MTQPVAVGHRLAEVDAEPDPRVHRLLVQRGDGVGWSAGQGHRGVQFQGERRGADDGSAGVPQPDQAPRLPPPPPGDRPAPRELAAQQVETGGGGGEELGVAGEDLDLDAGGDFRPVALTLAGVGDLLVMRGLTYGEPAAAAVVAGVIYFAKLEGGPSGATVGKRALSVKVVDKYSGGPIGTGRGVGRYFARILPAIVCYLGYLWTLWDPEKQTWHDKIATDVVVPVDAYPLP